MIPGGILNQLLDFSANDCVIYRKITDKEDMEILQKDVDRLGVWAVENAIKIIPRKSKVVSFTTATG
jgi:hypothetical protein